jgi:hypothetical protein
MTKVLINITHYCKDATKDKRPQMLSNLLKQLEGYESITWDDNSNYRIEYQHKWDNKTTFYHFKENHGKKKAWKKFNYIFEELRQTDYDYYFFLADDSKLCDNFIKKAIELWEGIEDDRKICLSFSNPKRAKKPCFTNQEPVDCGDVIKTQWCDMSFMCTKTFIDKVVIDPIYPERWEKDPNLSSGVGSKISHLFYTKWNLYNVKEEMVKHIGNDKSLMNPKIRKTERL